MAPLVRSHSAPHLDWPLSAAEKKGCVLRLYDQDVRAANAVIRSSEEKLVALQAELDTSRTSVCKADNSVEDVGKVVITTPEKESAVVPQQVDCGEANQANDAAEKLRAAIASATQALQALECTTSKNQVEHIDDKVPSTKCDRDRSPVRARSEGPVHGILCKDSRRDSRGLSCEKKRRVSFGKLPTKDDIEPEPEEFAPDRDPQVDPPVPMRVELSSPWRPSVTPLFIAAGNPNDQGPVDKSKLQQPDDEQLPQSKAKEEDGAAADQTVAKVSSEAPIVRQKSKKKTAHINLDAETGRHRIASSSGIRSRSSDF